MKKFFKRLCPAMILALTLCVGAFMFTACGEKDVEFKASTQFMSANLEFTLLLKTDGTAEFTCATDSELDTVKMIANALSKKGTYKLSDNVYTVTLGEGDAKETLTSTYDEKAKTHSFAYTVHGRDGDIPLTLKQV